HCMAEGERAFLHVDVRNERRRSLLRRLRLRLLRALLRAREQDEDCEERGAHRPNVRRHRIVSDGVVHAKATLSSPSPVRPWMRFTTPTPAHVNGEMTLPPVPPTGPIVEVVPRASAKLPGPPVTLIGAHVSVS